MSSRICNYCGVPLFKEWQHSFCSQSCQTRWDSECVTIGDHVPNQTEIAERSAAVRAGRESFDPRKPR